jgi:hypothetical protein
MEGPVNESEIEAEFTLETPVRCPHCSKSIESLQVVRILRTKVNFVSSLPRRGQVMICPECRALVTGMLGGLI